MKVIIKLVRKKYWKPGNINNDLKTWAIKDNEIQNNIQSKFEIFKFVSVHSKLPSTIEIKVEEYNFIAQNKKRRW